jgi:hypothetical protein
MRKTTIILVCNFVQNIIATIAMNNCHCHYFRFVIVNAIMNEENFVDKL